MIKFFLPIILFVSFFSNFNLSSSYENNEVEKTNSIIKKNKKRIRGIPGIIEENPTE